MRARHLRGTVLLSAYTGQARPAASASVRIIPSSFFTRRTPHLCFQRFHRKQVKVINDIIQFVYHKCKPSAAYFQCFHIFGGSCLPGQRFRQRQQRFREVDLRRGDDRVQQAPQDPCLPSAPNVRRRQLRTGDGELGGKIRLTGEAQRRVQCGLAVPARVRQSQRARGSVIVQRLRQAVSTRFSSAGTGRCFAAATRPRAISSAERVSSTRRTGMVRTADVRTAADTPPPP